MLTLTYIIKDMFAHRTRLILTILAIAWGTFSIATMLAIGEGLRVTFGDVVTNSGTESIIINAGQSTKPYRGRSNISITLTQDNLEALQILLKNKAIVAGETSFDMPLFHNKNMRRGPPLSAVTENYGRIHSVNLTPNSRFINNEDIKQQRQVVVLGSKTIKHLFKANENPLGQYVYIANKPFLVIGIQKESLQLLGTSRLPDEFKNWIPSSTYQALTNKKTFNNFNIAPFNLADIPQIKNETRRLMANLNQSDPTDPGILQFIDIEEQKNKINLFFYGLEIMLGIIGGLTLIVAGVGIANVMTISVKRSTREIGIRMAIGATPFDILSYYILEALMTTAIGGFLGLCLSKILLFGINHIPMNSTLLQYFGSPKPILSMNVIWIVMLTLGMIGFFAGLFPAKKAASIQPAEALRYEK